MTLGSALTPNLLLTPTQLSTHLACAHYTQLERKRRAGELQVQFTPDPRLEGMRERGARHQGAYIERLHHSGRGIVELWPVCRCVGKRPFLGYGSGEAG